MPASHRLLWVFALILAPLNGALGQTSDIPAPHFVIVAEGRVSVAPDMATVRLGVEHRDKTAAAAMAALKTDLARVMASLSDFGIVARDIQTTGLRLSPIRTYGNAGQVRDEGFAAASDITVLVRDLDALGPLLDGVVREGANLFQGLSYGLADPKPLEDAAREAAVAEALRRADLYAAAAGVPRGALLSISEADGVQPSPMARGAMMAMEAAPSAVPVAGGEVSVSARITATFGPRPEARP